MIFNPSSLLEYAFSNSPNSSPEFRASIYWWEKPSLLLIRNCGMKTLIQPSPGTYERSLTDYERSTNLLSIDNKATRYERSSLTFERSLILLLNTPFGHELSHSAILCKSPRKSSNQTINLHIHSTYPVNASQYINDDFSHKHHQN